MPNTESALPDQGDSEIQNEDKIESNRVQETRCP